MGICYALCYSKFPKQPACLPSHGAFAAFPCVPGNIVDPLLLEIGKPPDPRMDPCTAYASLSRCPSVYGIVIIFAVTPAMILKKPESDITATKTRIRKIETKSTASLFGHELPRDDGSQAEDVVEIIL